MGIDRQFQLDDGVLLIDFEQRLADGIVDPVMDVKGGDVGVAHAAAAHIGFIGQNQSGSHSVDRHAGALIVVSDGGDHGSHIRRIHPQIVQNPECHDGAGLGVVHPVDQVADIVQIGGHLDQLNVVLGITQRLQDIFGVGSHIGHMGKAVLGVAQRLQGVVCALDVRFNLFILFNLFRCYHSVASVVCAAGRAACSSTTKAVANPPSCVMERCAARPFCRMVSARRPEKAK